MDEQKKQPELFKANLFSSPGAAATSGGLSFGLAGDSFNSSFSLAPALTPAQSSPSPPRKSGELRTALIPWTPQTVVSHSPSPTDVKTSVPSSGSPASSLTSTPAVKTTPISSLATPTPAVEAELSNVPLDSPPPSSFSRFTYHYVYIGLFPHERKVLAERALMCILPLKSAIISHLTPVVWW